MTGEGEEEEEEVIGEAIYTDRAKTTADLWPCRSVPTGSPRDSLSHYRSTPSRTRCSGSASDKSRKESERRKSLARFTRHDAVDWV